MKLYHHYEDLRKEPAGNERVIAIGNFDGVHLGHQRVIATGMARAAAENLGYAICTFDPHPARYFHPDGPELSLTTATEKYRLLEDCRVPLLLAQRFDEPFSRLNPTEFARIVLLDALGARRVMVGANFRFGHGRDGDVPSLQRIGRRMGFAVESIPLVEHNGFPISSSRIRALILSGDLPGAATLLGRPYCIRGKVVHGMGAGSGLGFPTVNIASTGVLIPPTGIYAARCVLDDGRTFPAAAYAGHRPTLGHGWSIEAHLLDFHGDLYNSELTLLFLQRLRGDIRFENADALREQIAKDVAAIREVERGV